MMDNYIKMAWRNLRKERLFGLLNISGLSVGIMVASLIFLWVEDEVNYDNHVDNKSRIMQVQNTQLFEGQTYVSSSSPGPLAPALKADFPEIERSARSSWLSKSLFGLGDRALFEYGRFVDEDFLTMFSLQLVDGFAEQGLSHPNQVMISEAMAMRFFNKTNVAGSTIQVDANTQLTVSAVFKDLPSNVSVEFDWLRPFEAYFNQNPWLAQWGSNAIQTFVQVKQGTDLAALNNKIHGFIPAKSGNTAFTSKLRLYPMERWHLYNAFDKDGNEIEGRVKYVRLFSIVAWIVLVIACINFMNLATARSQKRAKEIGVKKAVGADRGSLIAQFFAESTLQAGLAGLLAVLLSVLALPYFNSVVSKELSLGLDQPSHLLFLMGIILVTGLLAGSYPALYLSSFDPVRVLKGAAVRSAPANFVRRGLVILQFAASITLVVCSILIYMQIKHAKSKDIGYDRYGLLTTVAYPKVAERYRAIKHQLQQQGLVEAVGLSDHSMLSLGANTGDYFWDGKEPNQQILITVADADGDHFETIGLKMLAGRTFKTDLQADSHNVIINKSLATLMGVAEDPIGKTISRSWADFTIIGMVDDFMVSSVYEGNEPALFSPLLSDTAVLTMRIAKHADMATVLPKIEDIFKQFNPEYPFEYRFLDEQFDRMFRLEALAGELSRIFSVMAIFISCLGLFGLAAYTAERRTKEIGIRKVLGASVMGLTNMLTKEFVILVGISCLFAFPLSYTLMENWLQNFSYRIDMAWWVFAVAGLLAVAVAIITVSFQSIRAALANPVHSLRDE